MLLAVLISNSEGNILVERFNGVPAEERLHWRSFLVKLGAENLKGAKSEELFVASHNCVFKGKIDQQLIVSRFLLYDVLKSDRDMSMGIARKLVGYEGMIDCFFDNILELEENSHLLFKKSDKRMNAMLLTLPLVVFGSLNRSVYIVYTVLGDIHIYLVGKDEYDELACKHSHFPCFSLMSEVIFVITSTLKDVCGKPPTERMFLDKYGKICLSLDEVVWGGVLENTDKDRIKRLVRLKPPTEF
ncbi:hypothetical protein Cgig2_019164 [Carnegiea gigantea]|uniref:Coatomer subunit zeta n=1 Tax=Carnegiea gigantea TaxID=171969 RepID=A0A9Q1JJJ5_9CARY|nr:hypothetical protein Cgig2_019164 [Carnegiea gigantea]